MRLTSWVLAAYGALGALGAFLAMAFGQSPIMRTPWIEVSGVEAALASLVLGICGAALAVILTRFLLRRAKWARALHDKLRPLVRFEDDGVLWLMAIASSVGEELFFRGFLSVTIGVVLSSVAFGVLHQVRGAGRFVSGIRDADRHEVHTETAQQRVRRQHIEPRAVGMPVECVRDDIARSLDVDVVERRHPPNGFRPPGRDVGGA